MNDNESILSVMSEHGREIKWHDDGWGKLWRYHDADGRRAIIRASSEADAYEIVLDEILTPITVDELPEAYDDDGVDLVEGYEYQSNMSGTGIVQICLEGELLKETTVQELKEIYAIHVEVETDDE